MSELSFLGEMLLGVLSCFLIVFFYLVLENVYFGFLGEIVKGQGSMVNVFGMIFMGMCEQVQM